MKLKNGRKIQYIGLILYFGAFFFTTCGCKQQSKRSPLVVKETGEDTKGKHGGFWDKVDKESDSLAYPSSAESNTTTQPPNQTESGPFWGCGYNPTEKAENTSPLFEQTLKSTPTKLQEGQNWQSEITGLIDFKTYPLLSRITTSYNIDKVRPESVKPDVIKGLEDFSYQSTFTGTAYEKINEILGRKDPTCGFMMANTISMASQGHEKSIKIIFNKPFPYMFKAIVTKDRIHKELNRRILIDDITATIESNSSDVLAHGKTRKGKVEIFLINPKRTVTDSLGKELTFDADYAFRVIAKFEGNSAQAESGIVYWLNQVSDFYVKDKKVIGMVKQLDQPALQIIIYQPNNS